MREYVLPGNKKYIEGDTIPRPDEDEAAAARRADGEGEDEFRFALSDEEFLDLFLEDLELPDLAKRQVTGDEEAQPAPGRLSRSRARRRRCRCRARCAIRCRAASRWGGRSPKKIAALRGRDRTSWTMRAGTTRKWRSCARSWRARPRRMQAHPVHRSARRALSPLRTGAQADRAGGDVLPDGRLRLDGRAHEGSGQAVLSPALSLPQAPLRACRRRLHPPHARGEGGGRGDLLPQPRDRRHGGVDGAGGDGPHRPATAIRSTQWNIYAAQASDGDNLPMRQCQRARAAARGDPADVPVLRLSRSRLDDARTTPARRAPTNRCGAPTSAWPAATSRMAMRKVRHRRDIYPVFRELFAQDGAKAEA